MLTLIESKDKDSNVQLLRLIENVYILKVEYNSISFLKKGARIWVDKGDYYNVYELNKDLPSNSEEELQDSAEQLIQFTQ